MKKILTKKGFTLIELIVVIAILAILAAILIPSLMNYIARATNAKDVANARSLYSEVVLGVAVGDIPVGTTSRSLGNTDCTFVIGATTKVVSNFQCTVDGTALVLDFLTP